GNATVSGVMEMEKAIQKAWDKTDMKDDRNRFLSQAAEGHAAGLTKLRAATNAYADHKAACEAFSPKPDDADNADAFIKSREAYDAAYEALTKTDDGGGDKEAVNSPIKRIDALNPKDKYGPQVKEQRDAADKWKDSFKAKADEAKQKAAKAKEDSAAGQK